jgi:DNA (cytosine-5)-methyltransferase 3A
MNNMKVVSLFDGMSCGQLALKKAGLHHDTYLASEVKSDAIVVTQRNFPTTIQLGDVTKLDDTILEHIPSGRIDLFMGGSPCQNFSIANKHTRTGLEGEKSKLFYEWLKWRNKLQPKYWLLENVRMKKDQQDIISKELGVEPIFIDSHIATGVYRKRLYWTNIPLDNVKEWMQHKIAPHFSCIIDGWSPRKYGTCLLESDSRPNTDLVKLARRYFKVGFGNIIFKDKATHDKLKEDYTLAQEGDLRVMTRNELERAQGVPNGYTLPLTRNQAAGLLGDGWQVDTVAQILKGIKYDNKN